MDGPPSSQNCVPVSVGLVDKDEDADENVVADQTRMERPVSVQSFTQLEEIDIDFRVSGLPHAVVKQAGNFRVRELVKKIESHPHRQALQADLQQNNVHNPFRRNSKAMIRELGNVELFESCETTPKVQCSRCLLYWNQGIIYCTCGISPQQYRRWHPSSSSDSWWTWDMKGQFIFCCLSQLVSFTADSNLL